MIQAIKWEDDHLQLLDQTKLPERTEYLRLTRIEEAYEAIRSLRVRGAPAIGITAAYGLYLGMRSDTYESRDGFFEALEGRIDYLAGARPTAVNLYWALQELKDRLQASLEADPGTLAGRLLEMAKELHQDDRQRCDQIGEHGLNLVKQGAGILTHCNTGALATGGIGTAFGVIQRAHEAGKQIRVYAGESRPVLQGARLTMWELRAAGIPSQLCCDGSTGALMQQGKVDVVIVGADRIAADGSVANKIGTYPLAIMAAFHGVPFYVAAPLSTFDLNVASGEEIPIEVRDAKEVREVLDKGLITVPDAECWNPAFDVTPADLITGIITERGIVYPPYKETIRAMVPGPQKSTSVHTS